MQNCRKIVISLIFTVKPKPQKIFGKSDIRMQSPEEMQFLLSRAHDFREFPTRKYGHRNS